MTDESLPPASEPGPTPITNGLTRKGEGADVLEGNVCCPCGSRLSPVANEFNVDPVSAFGWLRGQYEINGSLPEAWFLQDVLRCHHVRVREAECPECHTKATSIAPQVYPSVVVAPSADGQDAKRENDSGSDSKKV